MKTNIFAVLICTLFMSISSLSAQTTVNFSFKIWKNSMTAANLLGTFNGAATTISSSPIDFYYTTTNAMSSQLCPGETLIIKQTCAENGAQLNFNTSSHATVGLTNGAQSGSNVTPIATVCPSSPNPCVTGAQNFPSWSWGNTITITLPTAPTNSNYLAIGNAIFGNTIPATNCATLVAFIPINLAPSTSISDLSICPGDAVSVPVTPGFSYSNWNLPDPNVTAPTVTTNYTVDITHIASGCTQNESFTINVEEPGTNLTLLNSLCYDRSTLITQNNFFDLYNDGLTTPLMLTVNGVVIVDVMNNIFDLPHVIDAPNYGAGTVTVEYTYSKGGVTCTKTYNLVIHPEVELNMQNTYAFCSNNFQPICATTNGVAQAGITYVWTQSGVPFSVGTGVCFTPTAYGTYSVRAYDEFGCSNEHSFTVYNPGVGIKHPANITFCSLTQHTPSYIGWIMDPFGATQYSFSWTYTTADGSATYPIPNTGAQYQVPYWGAGTYTAVVNANGCTETISIVVTDLLQVYNNSSNAFFNFTPLWGGNQVSCQPINTTAGLTRIWTVVDQFNNTISTTPYFNGIRFTYLTGVSYTVTLRIEDGDECQVHINQFTWLDDVNKNNDVRSRNNTTNTTDTPLATDATTMEVFPNPTTGLVNIRLTDKEVSTTRVQVLNTLGQIILDKEVEEENSIQLDLSKEMNGVYLIQVLNGTSQFSKKIIKN